MNNILIRKKHSKRIAELALKLGIIDNKMFDSLYMSESCISGSKNSKINGRKYKIFTLYEELHYCRADYWGEYDEMTIISYVKETLHYYLNKFDENGKLIKPLISVETTLDLIKCLNKLKKSGWKYNDDVYGEKINNVI